VTSAQPGPDAIRGLEGHRTYRACGVEVTVSSAERAAWLVAGKAAGRGPYEVHLCNAYTLSLVDSDPQLADALQGADLNLPDGVPVAWLGRKHGQAGPVRGPDLMRDVFRVGARFGLSHYLYGGAPGVADAVASELRRKFPQSRLVGAETPPYRDLSDEELGALARRIENSSANVVWVGLGTPRQDYLVPRLAGLTSCAVVPVGAAFDFIAGTIREAPAHLRGSGLEWLFRLTREPSRLGKRYFLGNARFAISALRHRRAAGPPRLE